MLQKLRSIRNLFSDRAVQMALLALLIVVSMFLHLIEFDHHHNEVVFGEGVQAITHASEKKKIVSLPVLGVVSNNFTTTFSLTIFVSVVVLFINPIQKIISKGILQPKICD